MLALCMCVRASGQVRIAYRVFENASLITILDLSL